MSDKPNFEPFDGLSVDAILLGAKVGSEHSEKNHERVGKIIDYLSGRLDGKKPVETFDSEILFDLYYERESYGGDIDFDSMIDPITAAFLSDSPASDNHNIIIAYFRAKKRFEEMGITSIDDSVLAYVVSEGWKSGKDVDLDSVVSQIVEDYKIMSMNAQCEGLKLSNSNPIMMLSMYPKTKVLGSFPFFDAIDVCRKNRKALREAFPDCEFEDSELDFFAAYLSVKTGRAIPKDLQYAARKISHFYKDRLIPGIDDLPEGRNGTWHDRTAIYLLARLGDELKDKKKVPKVLIMRAMSALRQMKGTKLMKQTPESACYVAARQIPMI